MSWRSIIAVLALACLCACGDSLETGVLALVRVSGVGYVDPTSATYVTDVKIEVYGRRGASTEAWEQRALLTRAVSEGRPTVYGIYPRDGQGDRLYMTVVTLMHREEALERRVAIGTFQPGRVGVLEIAFTAGGLCLRQLCVDANGRYVEREPCEDRDTRCVQACDPADGRCADVAITPAGSLANYDRDNPPPGVDPDAGPPDDAGVPDAPRDGGPDARDADARHDGSDGRDADADHSGAECGPDLPGCSDGLACTTDTCDTETGRCTFEVGCDDGDPCTVDSCDMAGECQRAPLCVDADASDCTTLACVRSGTIATCEMEPRADNATCTGGRCCSGSCVDTMTSGAHCGGCGNPCGPSSSCSGGMCGCTGGRVDCTADLGCETDPMTDEMYCGASGASCTGGTMCTGPTACIDGTCRACTGDGECDDGLACTGDTCAMGRCTNPLQAGSCLIGGVCYANGAASPFGPCARCNTATSTTMFSPAPGAACSDGQYCTTEACNAIATGMAGCQTMPRNCADSLSCTTDSCSEPTDQCVHTLTGCLIGGTCYAAAAINPGNQCEECDPLLDQYTFSPRTGNSCVDGLYCTVMETCDSDGVCGSIPLDCTDDGEFCTDDVCNETLNRCDYPPAHEGEPCDVAAQCMAGSCQAVESMCEMCETSPGVCGCSSVGGGCYQRGDTDPEDHCRTCTGEVDRPNVIDSPNGTLCSPPSPGMCMFGFCMPGAFSCDEAQVEYLRSEKPNIESYSLECGTSCFTYPDPHQCFIECFMERVAGSPLDDMTCLDCVADRYDCVRSWCLGACSGGAGTPECYACQCGFGCVEQFDLCSGSMAVEEECSG